MASEVFDWIRHSAELHAKGYRYAISGMVHPLGRITEEMSCDLIPIPDSSESYGDMIR